MATVWHQIELENVVDPRKQCREWTVKYFKWQLRTEEHLAEGFQTDLQQKALLLLAEQ